MDRNKLQEVAFYYPGPVWHSSETMKNLLLFFDGIALLVPDYIRSKPERVHPELAGPLLDKGLLHILEPKDYVDAEATTRLVDRMGDVFDTGVLETLSPESGEFHELSMSRLGFSGDANLAQELLDELKARGLAKETEDGVSIPMHPRVRVLILVFLAQILRHGGPEHGLELLPTTDRSDVFDGLTEFLNAPQMASSGSVVSSDLEVVAVDLSLIPLDEVLDYRKQHLKEHKAYAREVRQFVRTLTLFDKEERLAAMADRREDLLAQAASLRAKATAAWANPASLALAGTGAIWSVATGDPTPALFGFGSAAIAAKGLQEQARAEIEAFSYLLSMPHATF